MSRPPPKLGVLNFLSSSLRWAVGGSVFVTWGIVVTLLSPFLSARRLFPFSQQGFRLMLRIIGVKVVVRGIEHVDPKVGYVFMVNHASFLDHFVLVSRVPQFIVGLEKSANFKLPIYGRLTRWWGNIPVVREDPAQARAAIEIAKGTVRAGTSIGLAPEGTRSTNGRIGPFKKGGFHLARDSGAPIVPVTLLGMKAINPDRAFRVVAGTVTLVFHAPDPANDAILDDAIARIRDRIASAGVEKA